MKFSHMADCHIGGWRDTKLRELGRKAFVRAIDITLKNKVDFVLISGDLFNTSLPAIDDLRIVVKKLRELKEHDIPVYIIAGSHDFSPSGKTILDVLEEAQLLINVVKADKELTQKHKQLVLKFTEDKSGAKITGMLGKKGMLEKTYYKGLYRKNLEEETGFKIFMFHTAITELKPKDLARMDSSPVSLLPKNFDYYAGGHVHIVKSVSLGDYKNVVYPGPLFPNNFSELEKLKKGGFYIYEDGQLTYNQIEPIKVHTISVNADNKSAEQVTMEILDDLEGDYSDSLVLIRLEGTLCSGRPSDIEFTRIYSEIDAYFIMRNTSKLKSKEFEEIKVTSGSMHEVEESVISEHLGKINVKGWDMNEEKNMTKKLMTLLDSEKKEGEKVYEFEKRIVGELSKLLDIL